MGISGLVLLVAVGVVDYVTQLDDGTMSGMELTGRFGMLGMVFLNNATAMPNLPSPADLRWSNR
ncbi:hypothetical protein ABIE32_003634 [Comamonas sp. 4034]